MSGSLRLRPGRTSPVALALAIMIWPVALPAQEAAPPRQPGSPDPQAVLASRGLEHAGNLYLLLDMEIAVENKNAEDREDMAALQAEAATVENERQVCRDRWLAKRAEIAPLVRRRDGLIALIPHAGNLNEKDGSDRLAQLQAQIFQLQAQISDLDAECNAQQADLRERERRLRAIHDEFYSLKRAGFQRHAELMAAYEAVYKNRDVFRALKEINRTARPWVVIGPESRYDSNVARFARDVLTDAGLGPVTKQSRLSLAAEAEVRDLGHRAWALQQKLQGLQGADNLRALGQVVDRLGPRIQEVQQLYATLSRDRLIDEALVQLGRSLKKRLQVEPSAIFLKEVERLPQFEKALEQGE
jgi:prefoldin subunit 5